MDIGILFCPPSCHHNLLTLQKKKPTTNSLSFCEYEKRASLLDFTLTISSLAKERSTDVLVSFLTVHQLHLILSISGSAIETTVVFKIEIVGIKRCHKHASRRYCDLNE